MKDRVFLRFDYYYQKSTSQIVGGGFLKQLTIKTQTI